jgi:phosphoribosylaminoimidazole carboxylase (NCAIR synthetase)
VVACFVSAPQAIRAAGTPVQPLPSTVKTIQVHTHPIKQHTPIHLPLFSTCLTSISTPHCFIVCAQDKYQQKVYLRGHGIPVPDFMDVPDLSAAYEAGQAYVTPQDIAFPSLSICISLLF